MNRKMPLKQQPILDEDLNPDLDPRTGAKKPQHTSLTTTTEEPDVPGKKKRPIRGCKLPIKPNESKLAASINGLRYGSQSTSRTEIKLDDSKIKEIEKDSRIEFKFTTAAVNTGLLLLLTDNKFIDHTLVYLIDNKLHCSFNLGSGNLVLNGENELSLNELHKVLIVRESRNVTVYVDDKVIISDILPGERTSLNVNSIAYVGGLPSELIETASSKMKTTYNSFIGCINDVKLNLDLYLLDLDDSFDGVESCDANSNANEDGAFFKGSGYLQLDEEFVVGQQTKLTLEVKPRVKNGVILYAKSSNSSLKDFVLLELVDGALKATVNNGGQSKMIALVNLTNEDESCDGK